MFHCMLAYAQSLDDVTEKLADEVTARVMDLPGHGESPDWDPSVGYGDQALEMAVQCFDGPAHVVGHSFGGYLALRLAVERPDLVQSLSLIDPVFIAAGQRGNPELFAEHLELAGPAFIALQSGDMDTAARHFMEYWGTGGNLDALRPSVLAYCAARMPLVTATQAPLLEDNAHLLSRLDEVDVPVLILEGSESPSIMSAICDELEADLPQSFRVLLQGAGHMAPLSNPDEVAGMIGAFIASLSQTKVFH